MKCKFCEREILNKGSLASHEMVCGNNPNKIKHAHSPNAGAKKGRSPWNKGESISCQYQEIWKKKYPNELIFIENSSFARHALKKRILQEDLIKYKCNICGLGPVWQNKPMPLILDHINGINNDNRLINLRFVCSNCDSQLPTYKSKNKNGR